MTANSGTDGLAGRTRQEYRERRTVIRRILSSYPIVARAYGLVRFGIVRTRILGTMDVLLPDRGRILELGCGYGLLAGYFASTAGARQLVGVDRNEQRIRLAQQMAARLSGNAQFTVADVRHLPPSERFDAAYLVDVLHHIPFDAQRGVIEDVRQRIEPGGLLLVKEISTYPRYKLAFTRLLDRLMAPRDDLSYRHHDAWKELLTQAGFDVRVRHLDDILPYPHVLFICRRREEASAAAAPPVA